MNTSRNNPSCEEDGKMIIERLLGLENSGKIEEIVVKSTEQIFSFSRGDISRIEETFIKDGIKMGKYPDEQSLKEIFKATLMIILIKIDTTKMSWADASDVLLDIINKTQLKDIQIIGIGTCIGWEYDFILLAYTKGIGPDYTKHIKKYRMRKNFDSQRVWVQEDFGYDQ